MQTDRVKTAAKSLVVRHRKDGDHRGETRDDDSGDPPFRFRIALSWHLNAIAGLDAELIERRTVRDRSLKPIAIPQRRIAPDNAQPIHTGLLGSATGEHERVRQH